MGKTNKSWHEKNRMPSNATVQQRIDWHLDHAKACGCRPMPASIIQLIKERRPVSGA